MKYKVKRDKYGNYYVETPDGRYLRPYNSELMGTGWEGPIKAVQVLLCLNGVERDIARSWFRCDNCQHSFQGSRTLHHHFPFVPRYVGIPNWEWRELVARGKT